MGNLLITLIGIMFCAVLLVAGVSFIRPTAYIEHNQANNNSAQVEALVADYAKLAIVTGHRPTAADYLSVYPNGSVNARYVNSGGTITVAPAIEGVKTGSGTGNQWQYVPGCYGGVGDCFCLPLSSATDVTYKATQISALQQMDSGSQSRLALSTSGCSDSNPIVNPANWPSNPSNYYLIVQLNGWGGANVQTPAGDTYTCSASDVSYSCPASCGTAAETATNWVCTCTDGVTRTESYCSPPAGPSCSNYSGCTYAASNPVYGACSCAGTDSLTSWSCIRSDGTNMGEDTTHCTAPASSQTCTAPNTCAVNGACGTAADTCTTGTQTSYVAAAGTWTCSGSNGGTDASCTTPINGACSMTADTCTNGTQASYDSGAGTWTCTGLNGGTSAACTIPIDGACGTTADTCTVGTQASYDPGAGTWTCTGLNGGTSAACTIPINGACGTTADTCTVGTASGTNNNGTNTTWSCAGSNGGSTASCSVADQYASCGGQCDAGANCGAGSSPSSDNTTENCYEDGIPGDGYCEIVETWICSLNSNPNVFTNCGCEYYHEDAN